MITVYSAPNCPYCDMVKKFLKTMGKEFKEIDISQDKEKAEELIKKTGRTAVPVIDINGTLIIGFDKEKIEEVLKNE